MHHWQRWRLHRIIVAFPVAFPMNSQSMAEHQLMSDLPASVSILPEECDHAASGPIICSSVIASHARVAPGASLLRDHCVCDQMRCGSYRCGCSPQPVRPPGAAVALEAGRRRTHDHHLIVARSPFGCLPACLPIVAELLFRASRHHLATNPTTSLLHVFAIQVFSFINLLIIWCVPFVALMPPPGELPVYVTLHESGKVYNPRV